MRKNIPIEKIILYTIASVGLLVVAMVAPGIGPALKLLGFGKRKYTYKNVQNTLYKMRDKGLIVFEKKNGNHFVKITTFGRKKLEVYQRGGIGVIKTKIWDGKWRVVIFDIPEKRRATRNRIRQELSNVGFIRLQNSVWVCPYPCEEFIKLLKSDQRVGKYVVYMEADHIEYEMDLRSMFGI